MRPKSNLLILLAALSPFILAFTCVLAAQSRGTPNNNRVRKGTYFTTAAKPVLLDRNALPEPTGGNNGLPPSGSALAIAFVPDRRSGSTAAASAPCAANLLTETVRLIDPSDPQHPKTVRTFEGVTSVALDDSRKLVFLANNGGLWIVSHREHTLPVCSIPEPELEIYYCQ